MDFSHAKIIKLEGKHNYDTWRFQLNIILRSAEKYDVAVGNSSKPDQISNEDGYVTWMKDDIDAQRIIVTSVNEQILSLITYCSTSMEMLTKLEILFTQKSETSLHLLQQQFYSYSFNDADCMSANIMKLEKITHSMKALGEQIPDSMIMTKILMMLPKEYAHFYSAWDSVSSDQQTVNNLTSRLLLEEERLGNCRKIEDIALVTRKTQNDTLKSDAKKNRKWIPNCNFCKKRGHLMKDCWFRKKKENETPSQRRVALIGTSSMNIDKWYLDSGASDHMSSRKEWFHQYTMFAEPKSIRIGDGSYISAIGVGNIEIRSFNGEIWIASEIKAVLHVPDLKCNLFSTGTILDKGFKMVSDSETCKFMKNGKIFAVATRKAKLFEMLFEVDESMLAIIGVSSKLEKITTWHERLGHQNIAHVRNVLKRYEVPFIDEENFFCEACVMGKQHRLSHSLSSSRETKPGGLIHMDLCGPMEKTSLGGSNYILLFKDDYSSFRVVYFIKQKSEVTQKLKIFLKLVENQTNRKVKICRSDNGTEFVNQQVRSIMEENGVKHQLSVPYTPQQNGRAERDFRTIVEMARTMLHSKHLDKNLWAEAVNYAVYILNKTGITIEKNKSPNDLWFSENTQLPDFRIFGEDVYIHVPKEKRLKWDVKSKKGVFVGFMENTKGYKVYIADSKRIEVARDIIFEPQMNHTVQHSTENVENRSSDLVSVTFGKVGCHPNRSCDMDSNMMNHPNIDDAERERSVTHDTIEAETAKDRYNLRSRNNLKKPERFEADNLKVVMIGEAEQIDFEEAVKVDEWKTAMNEEYNSLITNNTWILTEAPENQKVLTSKWVFKIKNDNDGKLLKYKARLVIRGFLQEYGIDYNETFSPVARYDSIRLILAFSATVNYCLMNFDVKTAFLHGDIDEDIYMVQPQGYSDGSNRVCKLKKSLYGLKQAPKKWNEKFTEFLLENGFQCCETDSCVFQRTSPSPIIICLYVDDGLITGKYEKDLRAFLNKLNQRFEITIGKAESYLGMNIFQHSGSIFINQVPYIRAILQKFHMDNANPVATPSVVGEDLSSESADASDKPYKEVIGCLLYLSTVTRPDITYIVNNLSRHMQNPKICHWNAAKRVMRYLKGTLNYGLEYKEDKSLESYSDADFAGDRETRKSTSGFVIQYAGGAVLWGSRKQPTVALSTAEAEYVAASEAVREILWIRQLAIELQIQNDKEVPLFIDNKSAIHMVKNDDGKALKRTKHIDIKFHFIKEKIGREIGVFHIEGENQLGDIFTKPLTRSRYEMLREKLGVVLSADNSSGGVLK